MTFNKWLDKFLAENAIDTEQILTVTGPSGENHIPIGRVIEAIKFSPVHEQDEIREMFKTGDSDFRKIFMTFVYYMANIMAVWALQVANILTIKCFFHID